MNPELIRNLWLVMTPRRVVLSTVAVGLVVGAAHAVGGLRAAGIAAEVMFLVLAVLLGTRDATNAMVAELRDRTWDQQRLSSIGPWSMVWGKLTGGTAGAWYGGLLALAVMTPIYVFWFGPAATLLKLYALLWFALLAQAVAVLAVLVTTRRRAAQATYSWRDVLGYQAAGLMGAFVLSGVIPGTDYLALLNLPENITDDLDLGTMPPWTMPVTADIIRALTLIGFLAWAWVGCWRLMRRELQVENGPFVWLAFLACLTAYVVWTIGGGAVPRLASAFGVILTVVYLMVAIEPKDKVQYRWLRDSARAGHAGAVLARLPAWVYTHTVALALGAATVVALLADVPAAVDTGTVLYNDAFLGLSRMQNADWGMILGLMGFATRDVGLFIALALWRQRGSELAALVVLALLYTAVPILLAAIEPRATSLAIPLRGDPLGIVSGWTQAAATWAAVGLLFARMVRQTAVRAAA